MRAGIGVKWRLGLILVVILGGYLYFRG